MAKPFDPALDATALEAPVIRTAADGTPGVARGEGFDATVAGPGTPSLRRPRRFEAGHVFAERYEIERFVGSGGMGVVYLVRDRLVDERLALKLLEGATAAREGALALLRREVRLARRVTHPHVVRIHDLGEDQGTPFLTMEWIDGADLRRVLVERGHLGSVEAARLARDVATGLAASHAVGIVHRDLKPENVLLDRSGRVALTDFGVAHALGADVHREGLVGTPAYMAPEQVEGRPVDARTDVYALGLVLYELCTGAPAFDGATAIAVAIARLTGPPPDPRARDASVPEELAAVVRACLARDPAERPEDAGRVASALDAWLATRTDASPSRLPSGPGASPARSATAALAPGRPRLACLPLAYRGPSGDAWVAEALAEEVVDVLSRTRGLEVLGQRAVAAAPTEARAAAATLGVDFVIEGSVTAAGERLRIAVRMVDAAGVQRFAERFDVTAGDLLDVQERLAHRIAETLRLELTTAWHDAEVPAEVIELTLRARRILRAQRFEQAHEAYTMLARAHALAPTFGPVLAGLGLASVAVWFLPEGAPARDWHAEARACVAAAVAGAPDLAETHIAVARLASQEGRLGDAVEALGRALDIAPTSFDAHGLLGQLACEAGRADEGLARLRATSELEPSAVTFVYEAARLAALRGDDATFDAVFPAVRERSPGVASMLLAFRRATYRGDEATLRELLAESASLAPTFAALFGLFLGAHLGAVPAAQVEAALAPVIAGSDRARFGAMLRQLLVELFAARGETDAALTHLETLASTLLYDVTWLDACPLLAPLRADPRFTAVARATRARCAAVWRG